MKKSYSKLSILSLGISLLAMLYTHVFLDKVDVRLLRNLWQILGTLSAFIPILCKYRRMTNGKPGYICEGIALIIGCDNFAAVFSFTTELSDSVIFILYRIIIIAYLLLFNNHTANSNNLLKDSRKEFNSTLSIVICAMMAALSIILSYTTSFYLTPTIKVGFSGLPNRLVDHMFGPIVGAVFGGVMDVLKFLIKPDGGFFFGYTLTAIVGGFIYGLFYYRLQIKKPLDVDIQNTPRTKVILAWIKANAKNILLIFIANALVKIICNIGMNTLWTSMTTGKAWIALIPPRLLKNLIQIPVDTVLHFVLLKLFSQLKRYLLSDNNR
ncbi:MAG: folate family ECF transporter S component [Lachnospiraceae bacterium]|nr:folate family ECF transporter S component [Lachnospiraceae bacterium]